LLAQLQPVALSALATFISHSSVPVCAYGAVLCRLIAKRCQRDGAQVLHRSGILGEVQDAVEKWTRCHRDGVMDVSAVVCQDLITVLDDTFREISGFCDDSACAEGDAAAVVQQLRLAGARVDIPLLWSLFVGPRSLSALQLLKSGLPLALAQFLCAENDYTRPSASYQRDRLLWFFQHISGCSESSDAARTELSCEALSICEDTCRTFLSAVVVSLIDGVSSKEQVHPASAPLQ
jgi:hypothetical protein